MKTLGLILLFSIGVQGDIFTTHFSQIGRWSETDGVFLDYPGHVGTEGLTAPIMGPDGRIYVGGNGLGFGAIFRFDGQTGQTIGTFVDYNADTSNPSSLGPPSGMTFTSNGNLLVANIPTAGPTAGLGRVFEYDGFSGVFVRKFVTERTGRWLQLSSVSLGPDGNIYLLDRAAGVVKLDGSSGASLGTFISTIDLNNGFFGSDGNYYACSFSTGDLLRFDGSTGAAMGKVIDAAATGVGAVSFALFGPDGDIYAKCGSTNVYRFNAQTGAVKNRVLTVTPETFPSVFSGFVFSGPRVTISGFPLITVKFPETGGNFVLERSQALDPGSSWFPVTGDVSINSLWRSYSANPTIEQVYFRLKKD